MRLCPDMPNDKEILFLVIIIFITFIAIIVFFVILILLYQKKEKQRQQEIFQSVIDTEEKERIRIARDLHDSLGASLSAIKMKSNRLKDTAQAKATELYPLSADIYQLLDDACKEVRSISHNLLPASLLNQGLIPALQNFQQQLSSSTGRQIHFHLMGNAGITPNQTRDLMIYRIVQELINNALKHSEAESISIQLINNQQKLTIMVEDDGVGFDSGTMTEKSTGIGLSNIYSRVAFLKGTMEIESQPNQGSSFVIHIPL